MRAGRDRSLTRRIAEADAALAGARADDRGWDPALLEAAGRTAFAARHPGAEISALHLVQVVDRPGTDEDTALMRVEHAGGADEIELRRSGGSWTGV
jgi:hypothetical protein